jgi:multidrug transporter EmrE-like cation transporter
MAKFASGQPFPSIRFVLFYGIELFCLGIYAIVWQQVLKRIDLSVAYASRSLAILWMMVWSLLIFHDGISLQNLIGVVLILVGVVVVNTDAE